MGYNTIENIYEVVAIEPTIVNNLNNIEYDEQADNDALRDARIEDGNMYIGMPILSEDDGEYILDNFITPRSYFNYNYETVCNYLTEWSTAHPFYTTPQIMKLVVKHIRIGNINTVSYNVIVKTFWIKIIQRKWRNVFRERFSKILTMRLMISMNLLSYAQYMQGLSQLPCIRGMLC